MPNSMFSLQTVSPVMASESKSFFVYILAYGFIGFVKVYDFWYNIIVIQMETATQGCDGLGLSNSKFMTEIPGLPESQVWKRRFQKLLSVLSFLAGSILSGIS